MSKARAVVGERIPALDILRGAAVLGILWINIIVFGLPTGSYALPSYIGEFTNLNVSYWAFSELMVDGAMRGLFSCLFGASAMLYLSDKKLNQTGVNRVDYYYRRNILLILIGLIHSYILLWPYDVLFAYGVLGLFLFPLRKLPAIALLSFAIVMIGLSDATFIKEEKFGGEDVLYENAANKAGGSGVPTTDSTDYKASVLSDMEDDIKLHTSSYKAIFLSKYTTTLEQHTRYMYTVHVFDIGGMMLLGMALLKLGVLQGSRSPKFYFLLMITGFVVGVLLRVPNIIAEYAKDFVPDDIENPTLINSGFSRTPIMLGYIGLLLWLYKMKHLKWLSAALANVGKMALTNYILQTVICVLFFYGPGLGLFSEFEHFELAIICMYIWILQIMLSYFWLRSHRYGPLEWLWRSATYMEWQPNHKQRLVVD